MPNGAHGHVVDYRHVIHSLRRKPMALMIIDADHFKDVNDRFGHLAGDGVLKAVAACLQRALRGGDRLFRFGGEEFVVICEDIEPDVGAERAEALRRTVEAEIRRPDDVPVTVSIGVACGGCGAIERLMVEADLALYDAKRAGRNRVAFAPSSSAIDPAVAA